MTTAEAHVEDIYELTPMQQGMLFHSLLDPAAGLYVEQMSCDVRGELPLARWQEAWQRVLARHPVLRSGFMWDGLEKPLQVVAAEAVLDWHVEDLRPLPADAQERRIADFLRDDRLRGFALDQAPLVRCALFQLGGARHRFVWTYHHLLLDGWCFSIVLREVLEAVESGVEALPPPGRPYRDYIAWLQEQDPARAEAFWRATLEGFERPTPLPFAERPDASRPREDAPPEVVRHLGRERTARLAGFAREQRLTFNTLVQAAWALVLARTADQSDVVFGVTVSGRPPDLHGSEAIVGLFINTVPLRVRVDDEAPVTAFLAGVQAGQGALEPCSYSSLADIQLWSDTPHDRPLFDSLLVFENYPIDRSALLRRSNLEISAITTYERTNYPLTLVAIPGEELELRVMFDPAAFSRDAAERIAGLLETALSAFADGPGDRVLGELGLLDAAARKRLADWGQNPRPFDTSVPVHEQVAARARRAPEATAVVGADGRRLSYAELEAQADRVAGHLRALGVGRGAIVGVAIGRSVELVIALLGVLKAGAAYLPLDPAYPAERLALLVADAAPRAILTAGEDPVPENGVPRLDLSAVAAGHDPSPPGRESAASADDLAYVIYTSGSTGAPKGVPVSHRNLANLVAWHTEAFALTSKDRATQLASVAFDASAWEIWPALAAGASLHVVPSELVAVPAELMQWLAEHAITIGFLPTPLAEATLSLAWPANTALRVLLTGGDRLHTFPPPGLPFQVVNNYGPTETTVVATSGTVPPGPSEAGLPSIGRPVANARLYVLDRRRRPVLPGVVGELYIGGAGVARGYLNRPDLTAARFLPDPFSDEPDARMYASGDLASFRPDGTIAFHGRSDRQVQVRGVRVEPGEIEAALAAHPGVAAAAVVAEEGQPGADVRLVAFAAARVGQATEPAALGAHLAERLPAAMLPTRIVILPELPLTPNGKVDHAALAALAREARTAGDHVAPRNPHEEILAGIWAAVLGHHPIGVHDDFFAVGGHSLKATQVIARAREVFGLDLPVRLIFERRTIATLAEAVAGGEAVLEAIPRVDLAGDIPAAPGQERLWFLDALSGASSAYNVPLVLRLRGALDEPALRASLELLVERHEALRTTFGERDGRPLQHIGPRPAEVLSVEEVDPAQLDDHIKDEVNAPFSLTTGPLFRARLFRLRGRDEHVLIVNQHHIVADAWSLAILLRELGQAYAALTAGRPPELSELPIRYADWAAWQHGRLSAGHLEPGLEFWRETLRGAPPSLALPTDRPRPREQSFRGRTRSFHLAAPLGQRLEAVARGAGASLFMTVLGAFAAYLGRLSGQDDVVIGIPAANRDRRETEGIVGFFLNTLALRIDLADNPTFAELVQRVRRRALEAYAHQDVPFERVVAALGASRDLGHNPLFQVMFTIQGEASEGMRLGDLDVEMPAFETTTSKFDLALVVEPRSDGLNCLFEYSTGLFDPARIDQMAAHLENVLEAVARDPEVPLLDIPILTAEERRRVAQWSRGPRKPYEFRAAVPALVAERARLTPDATALVGPDGETLSYRELDARAGTIGGRLRTLGVGRDTVVGVCIERSVDFVVGLLAVWKAGGAYLPLDPAYPADRLAFIVRDAAPRVILTRGTPDPLGEDTIPRVDVRGRFDQEAGGPPHETAPDDLAYLIYTSGSTGAPKGVLISHRNLNGTVLWHNDHFQMGAADRATQLASVAFDAAVWEIWPPLVAGAALLIVPPDLVTQAAALAEWIAQQDVTVCFLPTPLAEAALAQPWPGGGSLRVMHVAGDRLHVFAPAGLPFTLSNAYGPTEATVCATTGVVPEGGEGLPSIGRPIGNTALYILDQAGQPVPPGVVGEIFIGGSGVARGYLNRPDLTEERFVPDPFWDGPTHGPLGARMYATGDLGRFNADGTIAFHGRRDRQVKVRGVRVEPAEIEVTLGQHPDVEAAAVVARGEGADVQLVAFVAGRPGATGPTAEALTAHLAAKLPAAMVPSRISVLDALPLTPHGKVDYAALVARDAEAPSSAPVPPRTPAEQALAGIWAEVLGKTPASVEDDFFALGGHSLRATQVLSRIRDAFGVDLPVRTLFERRTIARLAEVVAAPGESTGPIPRADLSADLPLAPGQESLWFIDALDGGSAAYNVPLVLRLDGALDTDVLGRALALLVERHEVLRTTFHESAGGIPVQRIGPPPTSVLVVEEVEPAFLDRRLAEEIAAPFPLAQGPLFRARLFRLGPSAHVLLVNQHHIIVDAWSIGVLLRELCIGYAALRQGKTPPLPALPLRYADWAAWQRQRLEGGRLQESLAWWRAALAGVPETIALPTDRPRPARPTFRGKTRAFVVPAPAGQRLEALAMRAGASLFMTVLGAFAAYLGRVTGQDDVVIGSPAANRDRRETEGVLGYFLNTLALRVDLSGDPTFDELLARVRKAALDAYAHQDVPFETLVAALGVPRARGHNPLFQVMVAIQGQGGGEVELPGVRVDLPAFESPTSKFDLTLFAEPRDGALHGLLEYSTDLFDDDRIERMAAHLVRLLEAVAVSPGLHLSELPLLAADDERAIAELNRTQQAFAPDRTLSQMFARQVESTPDHVALEHGKESRTYRELDREAEVLADRLAALGVGPGERVAFCLDRSLAALTTLLAVLKAGGAYVPLDPSYPPDRLAYMLENARARVLVTQGQYRDLLPAADAERILVDEGGPSSAGAAGAAGAARRARERLAPAHLAYVLYTSGSTGRPKGVAMPHRALVNLIDWQAASFGAARTLQFAPLSFDVSFQETFSTWCSGGTLVLVDEATRRDPDALVQLLERADVQRLFLPSVALQHLAHAALRAGRALPALREVITAGDQLRITEPVRRFFRAGARTLHNHYGPTESHVVTAHTLGGDPESWPGIPSIGRPIANSGVHLLDAHRRPVPIGVPGELFLTGSCLADGYLFRPELTAERFVELHLDAGQPTRAYRTGDLGRLSSDGTIEFLGRADDQIKIRGFRVEPGEVERVLCAHPDVRDAAVIVDEAPGGDKRLVAYVVPEQAPVDALPAFLSRDLPEYMVPALFVRLPALPRTPSGKVDRRALPAALAEPPTRLVREARTDTERVVARAFAEVLARADVGVDEDFFALGGHSLLAIQVVARVRDALDAELSVSELFENATVAALAAAIDARRGGATLALSRLEPAPAGARIPLSFPQERLWFLEELHGPSSAYNLPIALRLTGPLDVAALTASLGDVLQRHRVLGMRFVARDGGVWQEPGSGSAPAVELVELGPTPDEALHRLVAAEAARPFDLAEGPLFRARVFRLGPRDHVLVCTLHHAVGDGWSIGVLVGELSQLYAARAGGAPASLPELAVDYLDYAYRQRQRLQGPALEQRLDHWRQSLRGVPSALNLPLDRPRPPRPSFRGATTRIALGPKLSGDLEALGRRSGCTAFMVLLAGFAGYLSRISGQDDVVVGTPVANRDRRELEPLVGFFVGTLPIRVDLSADPTFVETLARVRSAAVDAFEYQDVPLEKIVEAVEPERNMSHAPLFQAMLVLQTTPVAHLGLPGLAVEPIDLDIGVAKSDLSLILEPGPDGLRGAIEYATDLFDAGRIERMVEHLRTLFADAVAHPDRRLSELALLPEAERRRVEAFARGRSLPPDGTLALHERFEEHARRAPGAAALECAGVTLTYGELNQRANRLAHRLRALGAGRETLVALCVPRSFDLVVAVLAVWKSGAAYVPLDAAYPAARLDGILADSGAELLLSTHTAEARWRAPGIRTLWLDEPLPGAERADDPQAGVRPEDAAYVIYTSGSTGRPKGVVLEHRGLANLPLIHRHELGIDAGCVVLQFASISFDASVWEIAMALGSGGTLVLVGADTLLAGDELAQVLVEGRVTHAALPPTSLAALPDDREYPSLRQLISAGEACPAELVTKWSRRGVRFFNGYGPTESTVCATLGLCDPAAAGPPPIGRPALNLEGYVMDARGAPQPIGVPGELYIGGEGLARGYLRRDDLTREKFVAHPFRAGARLYRSGDLVRWQDDGTLEYQGRIDDQVKLRGFRIELGEIEAALAAHPEVAQALVLLDSSGPSPLLAAYVVPKGVLDGAGLRAHARKRLPEFMVPAEVVVLDEFPLTPNGKVDRRRLPRPRPEGREDRAAFVAPRTAVERSLAEIWERLLERRPIGAGDDFFSLGGHSLLAAQVMSRVRKVFGVEVPLSALFEHPTLEGLASVIAAREGGPELPAIVRLPPAKDGGPVDRPLSLAQERLRFLAELEGDSAAYNIPVALRLQGRLDGAALARSLAALVERHEVLRTCFPIAGGAPVARVLVPDLPLRTEDLRGAGAPALQARLAEESARPFSLSTGPVVRAHLFQAGDDQHVLLVVMHHIVADGWSIGILMRELSALYAAAARGGHAPLPALPIQYTDYAAWQRTWLDGHVRDQQLAYWRGALAGAPGVLDLPTDRPRPMVRTHRGGTCRVDLGRESTRMLHTLCRESGTTPYMALLAAFGAWLARVSGQDDLVIGSPFAGRRIAETEPLIGFFVNTLPLRVDLAGDPSFKELLERVRAQALAAHENQDVPFERLVEELHPERALGTSPIFQVMFALQQTHAGGIELPGLQVEPVPAQSGTAKFDLTLSLAETEAGIAGGLEYDLDLFDASHVESMARQLSRFVERLAADPGTRISDVDLLSAEERARLVPRAPAAAPRLPAVHEAIAEQARRMPDAVAVEAMEGSLTYAALVERASVVAAALTARGAGPDTLVALAVERSLEMMVGVLGILEAGAAYLPLDPAYPPDRIAFMLRDSGARLVLTRTHLAETFTGVETLMLDEEGPQSLTGGARPAGTVARRPCPPDALVYCLYTSGSTGQPKGVLIEHAALANHMDWMNAAMPLGPDDRVLQRTSLSFDASVWELFAPLMAGARLVLAPPDLGADTERLVRVMADRGVTVVQMVPSLLTALVEEPGLAGVTTLRRVCAGGEPLPSATVRKLFNVSRAEVWNLYGPTEATIDATAHRCRPEAVGAHGASEPIGKAIGRMEALVLDARLRPVPDGATGELYLAGAGLGRGYLNRPELTAARFIEHDFPGGPRLRLYKTGDVVRRLPDGTLLFGGRADRQVKLRGYRIELGEVEAAVARHPAVRQVAAVVRGAGGEARLVAFVVARERDRPPAVSDLRQFVERELAAHMVPGQFVTLAALPHAPNGKVDYRTLGAMEIAAERPTRMGGAPRDTVELELVRLFEDVLGVADVGINDSFFDLGGHSLLALKLKLSVEARLDRPLPLVSLFQNPTPAQLGAVLRTGASAPSALIPLTAAARAMLAATEGRGKQHALFLVPGGGATPFYLMPLAKRLEGVPVFGLQPRGLDGEAPPHETVEETAAWYAAAIRTVQPEGPYFLGGHSVGGHVAYEIAQQLTEEGQRIGLVALLDTLAPFPEATRPMGQGWDVAQWLVQIAAVMEGFFDVDVALDLGALRAMDDADRLETFVTRLQAANILPAGARPSHVAGLLNVARAQDASAYRPRRGHHVPLAVFRAEDKGDAANPDVGTLLADDTLGWNRFTSGPVAACRVPGTHLTLVREPHVEVLARQLLPRLTS